MIGTIKAEVRKIVRRPAFLVTGGVIGVIVALVYGVDYYQALHPSAPEMAAGVGLLKQQLMPHELVNMVMGAAFPIGAALAVVLGSISTGSDYSWSTLKTFLTQGPDRLRVAAGKFTAFEASMLALALILFAVGALASAVIASNERQTIQWPAAINLVKGLAAVWLVLGAYGALGIALGVLFRQAAAAVGVGLIYVVLLQGILVRFLTSFDNGQYKWLGNWFDGENAVALMQSFTSPAFGHRPPAVDPAQAAMTLVAYLVAFFMGAALILRWRDVT